MSYIGEITLVVVVIFIGIIADWYFTNRDRRKIFGLQGKRDDLLNEN